MPRLRSAEQALRLASSQTYVCRICRAQQLRSLHATPTLSAEKPLFERIRNSIFGLGSKESREKDERQESALQERTVELATKHGEDAKLEVRKRVDGKGLYEVAAVVDPAVNKEYVRAETWNGLERIGGKEWVKEQADGGEKYEGFAMMRRREVDNNQWAKLLKAMAIEVLLLEKVGRDVNQLWYPRTENATAARLSEQFKITPSSSGVTLAMKKKNKADEKVLQDIPETNQIVYNGEERDRTSGRWGGLSSPASALEDAGWMSTPLPDLKTKFAIAKRITWLTGRRVPDPAISSAKTMGDIYIALKMKETPKMLARTRELMEAGDKLPNVTVHEKKQTMIQKEQQIGRWKVIEAELLARGLAVPGKTRKNREEAEQESV